MVTAVILAAGAGRRMGGTPKALLDVAGRTCLEHVVAAARDGGCDGVLAVVRPGAADVLQLARRLDVPTLWNPTPGDGMFSSVRLGVERALEAEPSPAAILIFPVDHPLVRAATVRRLLEALREAVPRTWVQPRYGDRGGHPIAIDREGVQALIAIPPARTLRQALEEAGLSVTGIPVADPGTLRNLNTPQDLA